MQHHSMRDVYVKQHHRNLHRPYLDVRKAIEIICGILQSLQSVLCLPRRPGKAVRSQQGCRSVFKLYGFEVIKQFTTRQG